MKKILSLPTLKSIIAFMLLVVCSLSVSAQAYYMNIYQKDGKSIKYLVTDLDSIKFTWEEAPVVNVDYVDLGLSVLWATANIGANAPEEIGNHFAWGSIDTTSSYSMENYRFFTGYDSAGNAQMSKYVTISGLGSYGKIDNKTVLDPEDDVAAVNTGGIWRMPTYDEFKELQEKCTWQWTAINGVTGYFITSNVDGYTGRSIFLPAAGMFLDELTCVNTYGRYWSSSLFQSQPVGGWTMAFTKDDYNLKGYYRHNGFAVRPVCGSTSWKGITSIFLGADSVKLTIGTSIELKVSAFSGNEDYSFMADLVWSSDNNDVAKVSDGVVTAVSAGRAVITVVCNGITARCNVVVEDYAPVYDYVDLGLSVKWATCNLGAMSPEGFGHYYAWGETQAKSTFTWANYAFKDQTAGKTYYTKYNFFSDLGHVDYKFGLDMEDDAARAVMGSEWRMPTYGELKELVELCDWTWSSLNGVEGYTVTGPSGNSIFLPAGGYRWDENSGASDGWTSYLSATLSETANTNNCAMGLDFSRDYYTLEVETRELGELIRPVYSSSAPDNVMTIKMLGFKEDMVTVSVGDSYQLYAYTEGYSGDFNIQPKYLYADTLGDNMIKLSSDGYFVANDTGTCVVMATLGDFTARCIINVVDKIVAQPEYVDMGLSVKWATFNVGAASSYETGDYYAWGAIDATSTYSWENYRFFTGYNDEGMAQLSKYVTDSYYGENVDNLTVLEAVDDVASVKWGGNWRIPTIAEFKELVDLCEWEWTNFNGVDGYKVTSRVTGYMDRSIFLPAAANCYWSSSLFTSNSLGACVLDIDYIAVDNAYYRRVGLAVRPVYTFDISDIVGIMPDKSVVSLALGSEAIVNARPIGADGRAINVNGIVNITWTSGDTDVAAVIDGKIKAVGIGKCVVTAAYGDMTCEVTVTVQDPSQVTPESVDLGLSVKWATFNLGAFQPEMAGDYFAWGEAEPYYAAGYAESTTSVWKDGKGAGYTWTSYFDTDDNGKSFIKYSAESGRNVLDLADDAAHLAWGDKWRIPTSAEFQELIDKCEWSKEELNGVIGFRITSRERGYENNSIFMPITGYRFKTAVYNNDEDNEGYYWTSSIDVAASSVRTMCLTDYAMFNAPRLYGFLYRPVQMYDDSEIQGLLLSETRFELGLDHTLSLTVKGDRDGVHAISLSGTVVWSSSDESVATVADGVVKAVGAGVATITASYNGKVADCYITVFNPYNVETEYVDLGLSVNWATFNLGANKPEMKGDYFAWGETAVKSAYTSDTYKFGSDLTTKYGVDGKYVLDAEDDAAQVLWGGNWRMPTSDEFQELIDKCSWELTELNGVKGYLVTSKITGYTDKSIFIPITGSIRGNTEYNDEGYYWSSTMNPDYESDFADYLYVDYNMSSVWHYYRYQGRSIRPVCKNNEFVDKVILTDNVKVLVDETVNGEKVYKAAPRIVADPADSTNRCIIVTAPGNPVNYYDAQLFITLNDSVVLPAGGILELSFRYKADVYTDCATEIHSVPGVYAEEGPFGVYFSPRWQEYSISTPIMNPDNRTFVVNLAYQEDGNNFYFDDIAVTIVDNMADGFNLSTKALILEEGSRGYIYAHDNDNNELNQFTKWVSTNDSVAVVNIFGEVRAIAEGTCYILASYRDYKDTCEVTVISNNEEPYLVLSYHKVDTRVGHTFFLNCYTNSIDALYWESSDDNVAVVDKKGDITAVGVGSCFIVVSTGNLSDSCLINVLDDEYNDTVQTKYDFIVSDDSLNVYFYYHKGSSGYEMTAEFDVNDTTGNVTCVGFGATLFYETAKDARDAYESMTRGMTNEQIKSYKFVLEDNILTYTSPEVIGMEREEVLTMMRQAYNSFFDEDQPQQVDPIEMTLSDFVPTGYEGSYSYVDLGLSVNWASLNVGADSLTGYGDYFTWGETETYYVAGYAQAAEPVWKNGRSGYDYYVNKYYEGNNFDEQPGWTKYCFDSEYGKDGFTDRKTVLESSDDAASVNWGETWRTPTFDEILELHENCTWTWIRVNGIVGYKVISKVSGYEGRYIFIPASGMRFKDGLEELGKRGCYWSSELEQEGLQGKREPLRASYIHMDSNSFGFGSCARYFALTVRPVCSKN